MPPYFPLLRYKTTKVIKKKNVFKACTTEEFLAETFESVPLRAPGQASSRVV